MRINYKNNYLKTYILFLVLSVVSSFTLAQKALPEFKATDLNDKTLSFPNEITGKKALLGFAFSRKSQTDLETWAQPVYDEFIDKNSLASLVYDVNVYLVIVFTKMNATFREKTKKELRENILEEFYENVLLCEDDSKDIEKAFGIEDKDIPTLYTLNTSGEITSSQNGGYTEKKMDKLSSHLEIE